jgi:transcriptional regulator with XRE-family HTH domain
MCLGGTNKSGGMCQYVFMKERPRQFFKQWRKHRGLTQEQLAERIGIARSYLTKIERGDRRYDQPFLEAAAEALRCEPCDLIMRDPTDSEQIWSIWEQLDPVQRVQAMAVIRAIKGVATGTAG